MKNISPIDHSVSSESNYEKRKNAIEDFVKPFYRYNLKMFTNIGGAWMKRQYFLSKNLMNYFFYKNIYFI